ncbi:anti-sigma factor [Mesorhizobium sp. M2D.F.Ca.ET.185.01.1.1]|uniref:anti-sigma factor family protein n=1 Tax=unclassified Mesorhizobium TaxID=325217 RepID=UPI000FCC9F14|nr:MULTISPECIES: anti-sigma factor [unclassified Mesorhizobium]TGP76406.1 anti-sigma factor [bacterium M00.F.Ca.ET.227.01.1.1]TGP92458.1 anti-sigma factor [bacterium M00.F.Ca.ET.222.01.1.1]TGP97013.1 anti-sigma factor [bacterium M00.F.Ca.ET.221.01.1.1]TGT68506.1 anti-sigma factor [bacterium M00.F.Ca.ET.159.01.1.1]TGT80341.1 anti-sigma factor [bacterium M00.F.Ca.ET.157.01.1.1]TGU06527.1 anti-sigma factor [bacterium M00.F.Ca.ET.163.01.1.1]TGU27847.1 anti-sigma factor [bacterium M00.F.Ca.ET.156
MTRRDFSERDIHMALDGELPGEERMAYDAWLEANPEMKAKSARYIADRAAMRAAFAGVMDEPVPARLRQALLGEAPVKASAWRSRWWLSAAAAVVLAVGGLGGYVAGVDSIARVGDDDQLAEQAIAAHVVYAAEKRHAVEVPASDKEHLQTWLSNRVGLKLVAPDLAAEGFQLVGGRLLPAGEQGKAAMLLYEDAKGERISLFVTADSSATSKGTYTAEGGGPEAVYWLDKGYACAVVGSLPPERLSDVAKTAYGQLLAGISS